MIVPKGKIDVSAAIVPGCARTPLAVYPTFFDFPLFGPEANTGLPSQFRRHPQQCPQGQ